MATDGRTSKAPSAISVHFSKLVYPKPLPTLQLGPVKDELGFTLSERLALRQAWNLIRSRERRIGQDVFLAFLNEWYWSIYKFKKGKEINLAHLHGHALTFIRFMGSLIDEQDPIMFQLMLNDNNQTHSRCKVRVEYIGLLAQALTDYVLKELDKVSSPTLERGLQRLVEKFRSYQEIEVDKSKTGYNRGVSKSNFSLERTTNRVPSYEV
ncbi:uncharacterized protein DMAD_10874 [Drosophila madeirensis]|uniref:Uncharacterized protein n=1 Tax=Drosophila madeirensis TaxID=30013 RepID=A0AAU9FB44_DROMD